MSKPIKVLLIDDEEELLELYEMKLETKSHKVTTAISGNTAIAHFIKGGTFDLILCDINMPDGNGLDVFKYFKTSGIKGEFCFITGHAAGSPELKEAEATGATVFNKPVNWDNLWTLIDKVAAGSPIPKISKTLAKEGSSPKATPDVSSKSTDVSADSVKIPSSLEKKGMDLIRSINRGKK